MVSQSAGIVGCVACPVQEDGSLRQWWLPGLPRAGCAGGGAILAPTRRLVRGQMAAGPARRHDDWCDQALLVQEERR